MKVKKPKNTRKNSRSRVPKKGLKGILKAKAIHHQKPSMADVIRDVIEHTRKKPLT